MAHYTTAEQIDLTTLAARYKLTDPSIVPLPGGAANSSFRLSAGRGCYVLTALDNHDEHSASALARHTQALHRLGLPTSRIVPAADGSLITHVNGRRFVLKEWISGRVQQPLPLALLSEAGEFLADLHALPPRADGLEDVPVGARRLSAAHLAAIPDFTDREFADWLTGRLERILAAEAGARREPCLVHGDLFDDNIVVRDDGHLSVLDWETISLDDPLLDLGMAAVGLAQDGAGLLSSERLEALLGGYEKKRPLTVTDRAALPLEIEHAALIIGFHRYYRHNVRFPNPERVTYHLEMVTFAQSVADGARGLVG
ncbi:phosphotransferase [Streptomyces sp. NPDC015220]|uniref:phosphotransferase n=1 Tax=Streptomyces sp. NPDC015220 TaxID=3364947 RepID=UPI003700FAAF